MRPTRTVMWRIQRCRRIWRRRGRRLIKSWICSLVRCIGPCMEDTRCLGRCRHDSGTLGGYQLIEHRFYYYLEMVLERNVTAFMGRVSWPSLRFIKLCCYRIWISSQNAASATKKGFKLSMCLWTTSISCVACHSFFSPFFPLLCLAKSAFCSQDRGGCGWVSFFLSLILQFMIHSTIAYTFSVYFARPLTHTIITNNKSFLRSAITRVCYMY